MTSSTRPGSEASSARPAATGSKTPPRKLGEEQRRGIDAVLPGGATVETDVKQVSGPGVLERRAWRARPHVVADEKDSTALSFLDALHHAPGFVTPGNEANVAVELFGYKVPH